MSFPNPAGPVNNCTVFIGMTKMPAPRAQASSYPNLFLYRAALVRKMTAKRAEPPVTLATTVGMYVLSLMGHSHMTLVTFNDAAMVRKWWTSGDVPGCVVVHSLRVSLIVQDWPKQACMAAFKGPLVHIHGTSVGRHSVCALRLDSRHVACSR